MELELCRAQTRDVPDLVSFNQAMALETEDRELDGETLRAGVQAVISDSSRGFYLMARADKRNVGSLLITYEWSDWRNGMFWWVQSVYVVSDWRRRGVYKALYREIQRQARDDGGVCGLRLYVEHDNAAAQRSYEALGMQPCRYRMYEEMLVSGSETD